MAQTTAMNDGGTERWTDDVDATELEVGDRIDPAIVTRDIDHVGGVADADVYPTAERRTYQLAAVTAINSMEDVHTALLVDPETGVFVRGGRHDSQAAWNQQEADWKVHDVGTEIVANEVHEVDKGPDESLDDSDEKYAQDWIDIVFRDLAAGHDDYHDERELQSGGTLRLADADGRKVLVSIELQTEEGE